MSEWNAWFSHVNANGAKQVIRGDYVLHGVELSASQSKKKCK